MRIWSLHPKYLDAKGLVALWRETLLAKHVLEGKTKGYMNHPQLDRFKSSSSPLDAINQYLHEVFQEAQSRGYSFDASKFNEDYTPVTMTVNNGQLLYEVEHLLDKLLIRDMNRFHTLRKNYDFDTHPIFTIIDGEIENWEII